MNLPRLAPWRAGLLVALLASLVYLNTLPNAFVIDDRQQIVDNGFLRQRDGLKKIFTTNVWAFLQKESLNNYYRPLMHTVLYFWWRMFRENPAGYHALSILLHAGVTLLVFFWLRRIQPNATVAWLAALLFAVHPIHTEAVAWISAFPDLLCSLLVLAGFQLYLRAEQTHGWRRYAQETALAACLLLALLTKEIGFTLPLLLVIYEMLERKRWPLSLLRDRLFPYAAMAAATAVYLGMRWYALEGLIPVSWGFKGSRGQMVLGWIALVYEYTARAVFPLRLSSFHVMSSPGSLLEPNVLAGLVIAGGWIALGIWLYRRHQPEWLAVALFLVVLLPSFPPTTLLGKGFWLGERYLYLPSVGFCWLLAAALDRLAFRVGWRPVVGLSLALMLAYSGRTVLRNQQWRDEIGFYLHELRTEGESEGIRPMLADAYLRRGMVSEALPHTQAMVRLAPRDPFTHNSLGFVYWRLGERDKALAQYQLSIDLAQEQDKPGFAALSLNNLAVAYGQTGELDRAISAYRQALALDPDFAQGHNNLGAALFEAGRLEQAVLHLRKATRLNPASASAHANLGRALTALNDLRGARVALGEALRLEPGDAETWARLGEVSLRAGQLSEARRLFSRALELNPANQRALAGLSVVQTR